MSEKELTNLITEYIESAGEESLKTFLIRELKMRESDNNSLTIIANQSLHEVPSRFVHGELYIASSGNLNFGSEEIILEQYKKILVRLKNKLSEKEWRRVYLVPTGHSTLALQIKSLVYHVLRIDTIDLFYSKGDYYEIGIDVRLLLMQQ